MCRSVDVKGINVLHFQYKHYSNIHKVSKEPLSAVFFNLIIDFHRKIKSTDAVFLFHKYTEVEATKF